MSTCRIVFLLCALPIVANASSAGQQAEQKRDPTPLGIQLGVTPCATAARLLDADLTHPDNINSQDSDVQVGVLRHPKGVAPGVLDASFLCEAPRWTVVSLEVRYVKSDKGEDGDISFMNGMFDDLAAKYTLLVGERFVGLGMEEAQFRSRNTYVRTVSAGTNGEFFSVNYMTDGWARQIVNGYTQERGGAPRVARSSPGKDCGHYTGQVIHPRSLDALMTAVSRVPGAKDEFETTAAYKERVAAVLAGMPSESFVSIPFDSKYLTYDADTSTLSVKSYAVANENVDFMNVASQLGSAFLGRGAVVDVVVRKPDVIEGRHKVQGVSGTSMNVTTVRRPVQALFERSTQGGEDLVFESGSTAIEKDAVFLVLPDVSPDLARRLKSTMRAAVLVEPKAPYYAKGQGSEPTQPTVAFPKEIRESLEVAVVDFKCLALTDADNKVVMALRTR